MSEEIQVNEVAEQPQLTPDTLSDADLESALSGVSAAADNQNDAQPQADAQVPPQDTAAPQEGSNTEQAQLTENEKIELSRRDYDKLLKQIEDKQRFIERRSLEIGNLRKQLREAIAVKEAQIDEKYFESPREAIKLQEEISLAKQQEQQLEAEETGMQVRSTNERVFYTFVHPQDVNLDGYVKLLEADNYPADYIERFRRDPFGTADAGEMVQLSRRWKAEQFVGALVAYAKELKSKVETLEKKPSEVLSNIEKALNKAPSITAADGGKASAQRVQTYNPSSLSDKELEEALKQVM